MSEFTVPMEIEPLIRPSIQSLRPYRSARQDYLSGILLDANENSFGSPATFDGLELHRYPDPSQTELRTRLGALHGINGERVFAGVGSDEVIDLLIRIFCEPGRDAIAVLAPTYGMYRVAADINSVRTRTCLLTDAFQIDLDAVEREIDGNTKLIFCCSPNNPTANLLRRDDILSLCTRVRAVVVVDEAYFDFADGESLIGAVGSHPNLVVLRTLSKAWGLAGIRLGYAIANERIVSYLLKIKSPYNINVLTSHEAMKAISRREIMLDAVRKIRAERERLARALRELSIVRHVFPSDANFLLVRCTGARAIYVHLAERGIIVRDRSGEPKLDNCLRITVGTPEQNALLIATMRELDR